MTAGPAAPHERPRAAEPPPSKGIEVGLVPFVAGLVALLLVAALLGAVLWITREEARPAESTYTVATQPDGALIGTPSLTVAVEGTVLVYSMDYQGLQEGDVFMIRTGSTPEQVTGEPIKVRGGEFRQTLAAQQEQCGTVQVVRGSQRSGWSKVQCEKVGNE